MAVNARRLTGAPQGSLSVFVPVRINCAAEYAPLIGRRRLPGRRRRAVYARAGIRSSHAKICSAVTYAPRVPRGYCSTQLL